MAHGPLPGLRDAHMKMALRQQLIRRRHSIPRPMHRAQTRETRHPIPSHACLPQSRRHHVSGPCAGGRLPTFGFWLGEFHGRFCPPPARSHQANRSVARREGGGWVRRNPCGDCILPAERLREARADSSNAGEVGRSREGCKHAPGQFLAEAACGLPLKHPGPQSESKIHSPHRAGRQSARPPPLLLRCSSPCRASSPR